MIEVFKTNVTTHQEASRLIDLIHAQFDGYVANFDLQDCDNILRIKVEGSWIQCGSLVNLLTKEGYHGEVLTDEIPITVDEDCDCSGKKLKSDNLKLKK